MHSNIPSAILLKLILTIITCNAQHFFVPLPNQLIFPFNFTSSRNSLCKTQSDIFAQSLKNNTLWAYRLWDASAKFAIGLTEGNQYQLGDFDECMSISQPFNTQYCLAKIDIDIKLEKNISDPFSLEYKPFSSIYDKFYYTNDPNKIRRDQIFWGFCIPASCQSQDLQFELQQYLDNEGLNTQFIQNYDVKITPKDCQIKEKWFDFEMSDIIYCIILLCLLIIIIICTLYDIYHITKLDNEIIKRNNTLKYILCFSAKQNFEDLHKAEGSNKSLEIIYGIRAFMTLFIVMGHSIINIFAGSIFNYENIEQKNRTFEYIFVCRGELVVDMFFLLSGLLGTYSYLVQSEKKVVNPIRTIILRYTRFVPVFAVVTFFYATIFIKLGSGPMWHKIIGTERDYCRTNWWTNLLFINNYINVENLCVIQSWFLATDFQLFILTIPVNMLIKKNTKLSWTLFMIIFISSIMIPFAIVYVDKKDPVLYILNNFLLSLRQDDFFTSIYIPVHTRASTYLLGVLLGYLYFRVRDSKLDLSLIPSMWILNIGMIIGAACMFSGVIFYNPYIPYNVLSAAFFAAFARPAFGIAAGMLLFVSSFGKIPIFKRILNWSGFIPIAKLSFSVYMIHWAVQLAHVGSQRTPVTFNSYYWACQTILEIVISYKLAIILFIMVENPFYKLMKELLPADPSNTKTKPKSDSGDHIC